MQEHTRVNGCARAYLLYRGSILSCRFLLLSLVGSENLKNAGANSTSHLGSIAVVSRMYSLVVRTNSWYITLYGGVVLNKSWELLIPVFGAMLVYRTRWASKEISAWASTVSHCCYYLFSAGHATFSQSQILQICHMTTD